MYTPPFIAILHRVRSIWNVGSMLRTADGAGVSEVWLTDYTPGPDQHPDRIAKTALGAEHMVPIRRFAALEEAIAVLRKRGYTIAALERASEAVDYRLFSPQWPLALIVGNEVEGVPNDVAQYCDRVVSIPMRGKKESLNVAVAFGIAAYALTRSW